MKPFYEHAGVSIYNADCVEFMGTMSAESVDMIWTDPPYGHGNHDGDWNARLNEHRGIENEPIANDEPDTMRQVVDAMLLEAVRVLKSDCCCCCCCGGGGPRTTFAWVAQRLDEKGMQFFHSVIWDKVNPGLGWRYRRQHEMIMVAHKQRSTLRWADTEVACPNVLQRTPVRDNRYHPNEKPVSLVATFLQLHTLPGDVVLDPFMGSGTTLVTGKRMGRTVIGVEIEEKYCEIAAKRLSQEVFDFGA